MATGTIVPFNPLATASVAASTTAASSAVLPLSDAVLVFNASAAVAFVSFSGTAGMGSTPIPPGSRQLFIGGSTGAGVKGSVLLASGTGEVYFTAGNGTAY